MDETFRRYHFGKRLIIRQLSMPLADNAHVRRVTRRIGVGVRYYFRYLRRIFDLYPLLYRQSRCPAWQKKCLYLGLFFSLAAAAAYAYFISIAMLTAARIVQGLGFGLGSTFAAALAVDIIPSSRRGEGLGYFSTSNAVAMGIAPAAGVSLLTGLGSDALFGFSFLTAALAMVCAFFQQRIAQRYPQNPPHD